ncbi:hypothetical protein E9993_12880 [Labilibacter sediminis]|nr:hypothetical protein E9993_12880 [Labilibacter sediminis]
MKKLLLLLITAPFLFSSCENDDAAPKITIEKVVEVADAYLVNYGSYSSTEGSISAFDIDGSKIYNSVYQLSNEVPMSGKPQYAYDYKGKTYFMGNAKDEIFYTDSDTLRQTENGVSADIIKPRFCIGHGDYLYISCYGGDVWDDSSLGYIAKFNTVTKTVEAKIDMPGGPEGLEIVNDKLYCALNYSKKIAVMDLASNAITYIETPAVSSYFLKDDSNNLYVSLVSTYSDFSTETGLGYINTNTDELSSIYKLGNVSTNYCSIMSFNSDKSKIFVSASSWVQKEDDSWVQKGGVFEFNTDTKTFESEAFISSIDGLNGVSVNPSTDDIYILISESTTSTGLLQVYSEDGTLSNSYETGISPYWILYR